MPQAKGQGKAQPKGKGNGMLSPPLPHSAQPTKGTGSQGELRPTSPRGTLDLTLQGDA